MAQKVYIGNRIGVKLTDTEKATLEQIHSKSPKTIDDLYFIQRIILASILEDNETNPKELEDNLLLAVDSSEGGIL